MTVGHLNTFFAQVAGNLQSQILKVQIPGVCPGGGDVEVRIDRYITLWFPCLDGLIQTRRKVARVKKSARKRAEGE